MAGVQGPWATHSFSYSAHRRVYLSAPLVRAVIPGASPGLVTCLQIVIAVAVIAIVVRIIAAVMGVRPEPTEAIKIRSVPLRIAGRVAGLAVLMSFFVVIYIGTNLLPDRVEEIV